jgi:hypothetical protein
VFSRYVYNQSHSCWWWFSLRIELVSLLLVLQVVVLVLAFLGGRSIPKKSLDSTPEQLQTSGGVIELFWLQEGATRQQSHRLSLSRHAQQQRGHGQTGLRENGTKSKGIGKVKDLKNSEAQRAPAEQVPRGSAGQHTVSSAALDSEGLGNYSSRSLVLRFDTCGGLFNQHYCRIAGLTIAIALGVEAVIWGPALKRDTFNSRNATWTAVEAGTIWNLTKAVNYLAGGTDLWVSFTTSSAGLPARRPRVVNCDQYTCLA